MATTEKDISVALIGARGYVGVEIIKLLEAHPYFKLSLAASRDLAGKKIFEHIPGLRSRLSFVFTELDDILKYDADIWILAMPNGHAARYAKGIFEKKGKVTIIDLSSDHRFDDNWIYGLPEKNTKKIDGAKRISNPGCYATAVQLAFMPLNHYVAGPQNFFCVSGYSGAGTIPNERNDPENLRDNLIPYNLIGHTHEKEVRRHTGQMLNLMPHVANFFRGITVTADIHLRSPFSKGELIGIFNDFYKDNRLVTIQEPTPLVKDAVKNHGVRIGGFNVCPNENRAVFNITLDNLLKGAATQCIQNMNISCGLDPYWGILH